MILPNYTASTPTPRSSGRVRATDIPALTRTSDKALYSGMGAFGRGLNIASEYAFRATLRRQALDDDIESGMFTQKAEERINLGEDEARRYDFLQNMPKPDDPNYYNVIENYTTEERDRLTEQNFAGISKSIKSQIQSIKSPRVKASAEKWWLDNQENIKDRIRHTYGKNHGDWQLAQMTNMAEKAAKNGDIDTAYKWVDRMDTNNLITSRYAVKLKDNYKNIATTSILYDESRQILDIYGYNDARAHIMAQDNIDPDIRKEVLEDINFEASQQKLAYEQQKEQIEIGYLQKLGKEELSEDEIMNDLVAGRIDTDLYKEYANYVEAQARERLKGTPEQDWDEYDRLQGMVKEYGDGTRTDERNIRGEISKSVKAGKTTVANGMKLLDRVKKSDDTDDPLNKTSAKRALSFLTELKNDDFFWPEDEENDFEARRQNSITYLTISNELEQWIKANPEATDEEITEKVNKLTQPYVEEKAAGLLERAFNVWVQSPFGVLYRRAKGVEKKGKATEKKILTSEIARQYLELAGGDRARAEQLAKDDGYEW